MKKFFSATLLLGIIVLLVVVATVVYRSTSTQEEENNFIACTQEAKICPDGSVVGRTGPNCEFAECPKSE